MTLDDLKNAWVFKHKSLPIAEKDRAKIKPMVKDRAKVLWDSNISKEVDHPDFFSNKDWPGNEASWSGSGIWEGTWNSDHDDLPEEILTHLDWQDNTTVYFCCNRLYVIETTWAVFKRCWKNFLFMDDGSILIGKKRNEAVQFLSTGYYKLGNKQLVKAKSHH